MCSFISTGNYNIGEIKITPLISNYGFRIRVAINKLAPNPKPNKNKGIPSFLC
jgi:hypothetical protein